MTPKKEEQKVVSDDDNEVEKLEINDVKAIPFTKNIIRYRIVSEYDAE